MLRYDDAPQDKFNADLALADDRNPALSVKTDRRRPGRVAHVSPELVPVLRGKPVLAVADSIDFGDPDQLGAGRGIAAAVSISLALWAGLIFAAHRMLW